MKKNFNFVFTIKFQFNESVFKVTSRIFKKWINMRISHNSGILIYFKINGPLTLKIVGIKRMLQIGVHAFGNSNLREEI
ncbi:hypothetical protein BpHYR1_048910 [Brachionus plicatilis]|uniref:Uncharacterized protein n=1 Tax=Brachionus plicatilis TaxID=10195 RepID=A0A3M7S112_BRAPC|nr:hypothetical protein BpHYR1_048910 [Brachionus plicatilis]